MWASGNLVGHCCKVGERLDIAQIARTKKLSFGVIHVDA